MQTILDVSRRPVVPFDVSNVEHRRHVAEFLRTGTWANSPVAFYAPNGISARAYAVESLVNFYLQREFDRKGTKSNVRRA